MCLRTFLLLVVVRLVWMKVTKTGFVDDSEPSPQYLDPSSPVTSLDVMESNINTLDEELNDITSKMKEHTLEAMADTETTEVMAEAIRNNENVNQLLEPSEEKMDDKMEDILDMSEATKEVKQIPEMIVTPQSIVNNKKISNLTELTGEQSEEKTNVKNEKVSSEAVTEKIDNEKASNIIELLNQKENIMELSKVNDEDELTSKEITETNNAIDEKMEKKSVEFLQEPFEENNQDLKENVHLQSEVDDPSTIMDTIISEEMSSTSSALDGYNLTVNSPERIDQMEEDTKFIEEIKEKINFLEESINLHLVDLEHIKYAHEKIESESKAEDWTFSKDSIEVPLRVETFDDIVGEFIQDHVRVPSQDFENVGNPIKVKNYKEENNVGDHKYSLHPKEGIDLWFPIHKEDLDHEEDSEQITQTENVEKAQDDTPNEKTAEERTQTPDVHVPSQDFGNVENPIKVKNYKENNVGDQKYSLHPKEGIDLWFPIHKEDLDHVEDSEQITQTENVEKAQDDTPNEKTAEELTQTLDDELVYKETKINPNVKLLLKRTGFWKDNKEVKYEERSFWMIVVVGFMMLLVLLLGVLMGIIFLNKTDKKPMLFMKSLNLWGNDYAPTEISSIKKPKYNKIK